MNSSGEVSLSPEGLAGKNIPVKEKEIILLVSSEGPTARPNGASDETIFSFSFRELQQQG